MTDTGQHCATCGVEIHLRPIRRDTGGVVCQACVLEELANARERLLEASDLIVDLRAELVESKAVVAELLSRLALQVPDGASIH